MTETVEPVDTTGRRRVAEKGVIVHKDILDQPDAAYVLVLDVSPVQTILLRVDGVDVGEFSNRAYIAEFVEDRYRTETTVLTFSPHHPWYLVKKDRLDVATYEEISRRKAEDGKDLDAIFDKYNPKKKEDADTFNQAAYR